MGSEHFAPERIVARFIRLVRESHTVGEGAAAHVMTQTELSALIFKATGKNIEQTRLSKMEHAKNGVTSDTVEAIAAGLGMSAFDFYARAVELCRAEDAGKP